MPGKKGKRIKDIIVNVNIPQAAGQKARGGQYGQAAAGILFANPLTALTIIVVGLALLMILGGLSLGIVLEFMTNPWTWVIAIIIGMITKPGSNTVLGFSILVGLVFWGAGIYQDYTAMREFCSIPIIGWIACGVWNVVTFVPKLFLLGLHILTAFVQIWIVSFVKYELSR